jgi:hypothetical protein
MTLFSDFGEISTDEYLVHVPVFSPLLLDNYVWKLDTNFCVIILLLNFFLFL